MTKQYQINFYKGDTLVEVYPLHHLYKTDEEASREAEDIADRKIDGRKIDDWTLTEQDIPKLLSGQNIVKLHTLKSMYDQDCIGVMDDMKNVYRLKVSEILKIINTHSFNKVKKTKHTYLELIDEEE